MRLNNEELSTILNQVLPKIPEFFHEDTQTYIEGLEFKNDFQLYQDVLNLVNKWLSYDGIDGRLVFTPNGLEMVFGLEHPIICHYDGLGFHAKGIDRTYLCDIKGMDSFYNKLKEVLRVCLDFYEELNPIDLSWQVNKTLGDENILVTLQDTRITKYQDIVKDQFDEAVKQCTNLISYNLKFAHNTRSGYADLKLYNGKQIRVSVRDHQLVYEDEDTIILYVFTLIPKNITQRLIKIIENA